MPIGVSDLLWTRDLDEAVAALLNRRIPARAVESAHPVHALAGLLVASALRGRVACIEALKPPDMSSLDAIARSLDVAQMHYG